MTALAGLASEGGFRHFSLTEAMATFTPRSWQSDRAMTAIVSVYTPHGFIVGADGLRVDSKGVVVSESVQKLFPFHAEDVKLLYAWSGTTQFFDRNEECLFDFISQSEPLLRAASLFARVDFVTFLHFFITGLHSLMGQSRLAKRGDAFPTKLDGELCRLLVTGYFDGNPCMADIGVRIDNEELVLPVIQRVFYPLFRSRDIFSGSERAFESFANIYPANREEALSFVRGYIDACISYPGPGEIYGGNIHIAELTPTDGFNWVVPPNTAKQNPEC